MNGRVLSLMPNRAIALSNADIADRLESMAASIRAGEKGDVRSVMLILCGGAGTLAPTVYGQRMSNAEAVGFLQYAIKAQIDES